ncbi:MAG: hypothetical protein J0I45_15515 [Bosea sp.]|nr:hypothetical protein [Bosea sp. (in: a-proteobacteria)]
MAEPYDEGQGLRNLGRERATGDDVVAEEEVGDGLAEGDFTEQEKALLKRVDELIAVHGGDLRAVIETLLMAYDDRVEQVSFGFVRGRGRGG